MIEQDEFICSGTEEEIQNFQRTLDFGTDEIGNFYQCLCPEYQDCVIAVIQDLTEKKEFFGYNFGRVLKAYKNTEPKISQLLLSRTLTADAKEYLSPEKWEHFSRVGKIETEVNKQIDFAKKTQTIKPGTLLFFYVQTICDYLLIDMTLLEKGIGTTTYLKGEWQEQYMADQTFQEIANNDSHSTWNTRLRLQRYEHYLREKGTLKKGETIFETYAAVISCSGAYLLLKQQKKRAGELKAVRTLIHRLYQYQLFGNAIPFPIQSDMEE